MTLFILWLPVWLRSSRFKQHPDAELFRQVVGIR